MITSHLMMFKLPSVFSPVRTSPSSSYPTLTWVCSRPARFIMFGLASGLIRPASGTWGTLCAWVLWTLITTAMSDFGIGIFIAVVLVYSRWAYHCVEQELQVRDHVGIVLDEMVAFWTVLWLTPPSFCSQCYAFILFRTFDVLKPQPIKYVDSSLKGWFGVILDDMIAATYTIIVMILSGMLTS